MKTSGPSRDAVNRSVPQRSRREIVAVGVAAAISPSFSVAQTTTSKRLFGVLAAVGEPEFRPLVGAFEERLTQLGWRSAEIEIDARSTGADYPRLRAEAAALVERHPTVILAQGTPVVTAIRSTGSPVPVVFVLVADPVGQGLVQSLAHPGGSLTGFTNFEFAIVEKWL